MYVCSGVVDAVFQAGHRSDAVHCRTPAFGHGKRIVARGMFAVSLSIVSNFITSLTVPLPPRNLSLWFVCVSHLYVCVCSGRGVCRRVSACAAMRGAVQDWTSIDRTQCLGAEEGTGILRSLLHCCICVYMGV